MECADFETADLYEPIIRANDPDFGEIDAMNSGCCRDDAGIVSTDNFAERM